MVLTDKDSRQAEAGAKALEMAGLGELVEEIERIGVGMDKPVVVKKHGGWGGRMDNRVLGVVEFDCMKSHDVVEKNRLEAAIELQV